MNSNNWYISRDYNLSEVEKTLKILDVLEYKKHKVLCYYMNASSIELKEWIKSDGFHFYLSGVAYLGNVTDMHKLENNLRDIFLKKYGADKDDADFINEEPFSIQRLMNRFADIDNETLRELDRSFCEMVNYYTGSLVNTAIPEDKIYFRDAENPSFEDYYWSEIMGFSNPMDLLEVVAPSEYKCTFTWFEPDEEEFMRALRGEFKILITDDLEDFSNFLYYLNLMDYEDFVLAVNDNQNNLSELVNTDLLDICCEGHKFTKFNNKPLPNIYINLNHEVVKKLKSIELRKKFVDTFTDKSIANYDDYVGYKKFNDGICYLGYLWNVYDSNRCLYPDRSETLRLLAEKDEIYVMWDIQTFMYSAITVRPNISKDRILKTTGKDLAKQLTEDFSLPKEERSWLPEDIYIFDDTFDWHITFTHTPRPSGETVSIISK